MKKYNILLAIVIFLAVFATTACRPTPQDQDHGNSSTKTDQMNLTGRVDQYYDGDLLLTIKDNGDFYTIFLPEAGSFSHGDYIKASGTWNDDIDGLEAENIKILSPQEKREYFNQTFPMLEIEIVEYPKQIEHTCQTPVFKLKLTNTGKETISHKDIHTDEYNFGFYYMLFDTPQRANGDRENYLEVADQTQQDEMPFIGMLSNQGFKYFDKIEPGQSTLTEYWAGGMVTKTELGTAGSPNIFGNKPTGQHSFSLIWADKNNYDPIILFESETVNITLLDDNCRL